MRHQRDPSCFIRASSVRHVLTSGSSGVALSARSRTKSSKATFAACRNGTGVHSAFSGARKTSSRCGSIRIGTTATSDATTATARHRSAKSCGGRTRGSNFGMRPSAIAGCKLENRPRAQMASHRIAMGAFSSAAQEHTAGR
eukprot:scaffold163782_cov32-Tisochrysis_lutea.AAC.4